MQAEAGQVWQSMTASLASNSGGYEAKVLLAVCRTWSQPTADQRGALTAILHGMATELTTGTGLFAEWWQRYPAGGTVRPLNDMPHAWESALFYLSALCIDGGRPG
jgi:hypothetical protein